MRDKQQNASACTVLGRRQPGGIQSLLSCPWRGVAAHPGEEIQALIRKITTPGLRSRGDPQCLTVLLQWMIHHPVQQDRLQALPSGPSIPIPKAVSLTMDGLEPLKDGSFLRRKLVLLH